MAKQEVSSSFKVWNVETTYALGLYRLITKILGVWPLKCEDIISTFIFLIQCILQTTMIIQISGELINNYAIDNQLQIISNMSCNFLALIKMVVIRFKRCQLQEVLQSIIDLWNNETKTELLEIVKQKAKLGRNICIYQLGSTYFVLIPIIVFALPVFAPSANATLNSSEPILQSFPLQTSHFFGNLPTSLYWGIFTVQSIQLFSTVTGNVGIDCCFFGIAMNLCGQIECLALDFQNFETNINESLTQKYFSNIIEKHNQLIKYAEYMEDAFNFIILCIVGTNVSQVCLYGIQIIKCLNHGNAAIAINSFICVLILNFQIFLYSWAGDQISSALENLKFSSFNCQWDDMPTKYKKNLLFIMMRTHKTFSLTAGKIYRMDLDSFKNIVKAIGSYFSVMQAMFEE